MTFVYIYVTVVVIQVMLTLSFVYNNVHIAIFYMDLPGHWGYYHDHNAESAGLCANVSLSLCNIQL